MESVGWRLRSSLGLKPNQLPLLLVREKVRRPHLPPQPLLILGKRRHLVHVNRHPVQLNRRRRAKATQSVMIVERVRGLAVDHPRSPQGVRGLVSAARLSDPIWFTSSAKLSATMSRMKIPINVWKRRA